MLAENKKNIVLTGASGGIGTALARTFAEPGVYFSLIARDETRLKPLLAEVRALGADGETAAVDIRNRDRLHAYLNEFDNRHPIDLLIANAGVTAGLGPDRTRERDVDSDRQIDVNYRGVVNTVSGVAGSMQKRRTGQIVLVASLAGMRPLPDMPSYSASKAAVIAYGHSLRGWLKPFGVTVTIICPGFITSPMSARHKGAKPFEMSADNAAKLMRKAIKRQRSFYAFPFLLALGIRLQNLLPTKIGDLFMGGFEVEIEQDPRYRNLSDS